MRGLLLYLVYMAAGVLAVAVGSPSVLGLIGIVAFGAICLSACAGIVLENADRASQRVGTVSALATGAAFIYGMSVLSESLGWPALFLAWLLPGVIILDVVCAGELLRDPFADLVEVLKKGPNGRRPSRQRAAIRVLTPVLFVASLVGAILVAANIPSVPDVAFGNHVVFAGMLLIVFFYGSLFVLIPLARGLMSGQWPAELTTSGARYEKQELATSRELTDELAEKVQHLEELLRQSIEETGGAASRAIEEVKGDVVRLKLRGESASSKAARDRKELEELDLRVSTSARLVVDSLTGIRGEISSLDDRLRAVEP
jgi:hypothetical protein